ncbi:MAG: hypothetical protein IJT26_07635 [Bacteroidales bacterium]|nr:hypothetical protein [Bacteroidales bacterium]
MINKNDYGSYEAPEAILFSVRLKNDLLTSSPQWSSNANQAGEIDDEDESRTYGF